MQKGSRPRRPGSWCVPALWAQGLLGVPRSRKAQPHGLFLGPGPGTGTGAVQGCLWRGPVQGEQEMAFALRPSPAALASWLSAECPAPRRAALACPPASWRQSGGERTAVLTGATRPQGVGPGCQPGRWPPGATATLPLEPSQGCRCPGPEPEGAQRGGLVSRGAGWEAASVRNTAGRCKHFFISHTVRTNCTPTPAPCSKQNALQRSTRREGPGRISSQQPGSVRARGKHDAFQWPRQDTGARGGCHRPGAGRGGAAPWRPPRTHCADRSRHLPLRKLSTGPG